MPNKSAWLIEPLPIPPAPISRKSVLPENSLALVSECPVRFWLQIDPECCAQTPGGSSKTSSKLDFLQSKPYNTSSVKLVTYQEFSQPTLVLPTLRIIETFEVH